MCASTTAKHVWLPVITIAEVTPKEKGEGRKKKKIAVGISEHKLQNQSLNSCPEALAFGLFHFSSFPMNRGA